MRCITPERRTVITLSPPPPPPGRNRIRLSKLDKESEIIPSFLPCNLSVQTSGASSSSNVAMVATTSDMNQLLSRLTNKDSVHEQALKRRSMSEHSSQSKGPIELEDIVKSLPPPPLVAISTLKPDDDAMGNTLQQSQKVELLVQKNFMAKSA